MPPPTHPLRSSWSAAVQLVVACVVLGVGVAFLLRAALGSDGYSTLVNGLTLTTGWPFWVLNIVVGACFVGLARLRGVRPGPGTLVQWLSVGVVVSVGLDLIQAPGGWGARVRFLALAFVLIAVGVAGYLATDLGAGPAEAAALSWDPPVPFRWTYSVVQGGGALAGWLLGADIGPGTLVIVGALGPAVDLVRRRLPSLEHGAVKG